MSGHEIFEDRDENGEPTVTARHNRGSAHDAQGVSPSEAGEGLSAFANAAKADPGGVRVSIGEPVKVSIPPCSCRGLAHKPGCPNESKSNVTHPPTKLQTGVPSLIADAIETALDDLRFLRTDIAILQKKEAPLVEYLTELKQLRERLCK